MKTLIVVRHAKSSWADSGTSDHDRPLNHRGKKDAPEMAKRLLKRGVAINLFLSSTALRARTTAQYFAEEYGVGKKDIALDTGLYLAAPKNFYEVIARLSDDYTAVAVFSHNPGITGFVNTLTPVRIEDMPTCAIYAVTAATNQWAAFENADKQFLFYDYPKNQ